MGIWSFVPFFSFKMEFSPRAYHLTEFETYIHIISASQISQIRNVKFEFAFDSLYEIIEPRCLPQPLGHTYLRLSKDRVYRKIVVVHGIPRVPPMAGRAGRSWA